MYATEELPSLTNAVQFLAPASGSAKVRRVRRRVVGHRHRNGELPSRVLVCTAAFPLTPSIHTCCLLQNPSCQATAPLNPHLVCTRSARTFTRPPLGQQERPGRLSRSTRPAMSSELHLLLARAVDTATEADTSTEQYGYIPSISLGVIFITLFSLTALLHLGEIIYAQRYWFMMCMVVGGIRECSETP